LERAGSEKSVTVCRQSGYNHEEADPDGSTYQDMESIIRMRAAQGSGWASRKLASDRGNASGAGNMEGSAMYCPSCSQQVTRETNFCPRCGFFLGALKELIATGGVPPTHGELAQQRQMSDRQRGIRFGAKIVFLSFALLPLFFGLCFAARNPSPLLVPFTVFTTGVLWMLFARLFREPDIPTWQGLGPAVAAPRYLGLIPSPPESVAGALPPRVDTSEIAPPSVTEHTTNFLGHK